MSSGSLASQNLKRKSEEVTPHNTPEKIRDVSSKQKKIPLIAPIKLNIPAQPKKAEPNIKVNEKVQQIFNSEDESDEEPIPEEARIRMRNLGRFTPTSSGPNSYGKSRFGFIDRHALLIRQTEALNEYAAQDDTKV